VNRKKLAIIGNGMAAGRLLDDLLRRDGLRHYQVTVFGEEPHGCYNRILLSRVLAGAAPDDIMLKPPEWYAERGVRFRSGAAVTKLDAAERQLHTADGQAHPYDTAVFATGSVPFVPTIDGLKRPDGRPKEGVFLFRTVEDCQRIRAYTRPAGNAIVIGGGLLGLEAAKGLSDLGLHVTVVHLFDTLMNTQVDKFGGAMLRRAIEKLGIHVRTGLITKAVLGEERAEAVRFDDGTRLPTDLVVLACGIKPRVEVAKASDIPTNAGVVVNDTLATRVPGVYAVGECAEHNGQVYGIVQPIWEQCAVLADLLTGANPQARYRGSKLYVRLKVAGVEVASMGVVEPQSDADEVIQVIEERKTVYRKLIVRDGRLVGAMLVGDADTAAALVRLFERGDRLPANRLDVFTSGEAAAAAGAGDLVCHCHQVREAAVVEAIQGGCRTLTELTERTKAGGGCGSCRGQLANLLLKTARRADEPAVLPLAAGT
jgi:nitrite reductase (NADH) large subunit